ncbi:GGDEF domain-containing protein [Paraferrimonas sp. SM1919]|uniref:GGDEF domain-containing protein n=1 Tax=Paraferrimonas sp. SM1919 TaxID=2662263 RepID=UPI0013D30F16|nr:GGDEF domain-containing protein [Paraferrimonas sp. SM1919]
MPFSVSHVHITVSIIALILTLVMLVTWLYIYKKSFVALWCGFFSLILISSLLNSVKAGMGHFSLYWLVVNFTTISAYLLCVAGHRARLGEKPLTTWMLLYCVALYAGLVFSTVVVPHQGLKMFLVPLSEALVVYYCAYLLWCTPSKYKPAERTMIVGLTIWGGIQFATALIVLSQGSLAVPQTIALYESINNLFTPAAYVGMGLSSILIIASDLAKELRKQANTDTLTGALNRRGLTSLCMQQAPSAEVATLVLIDLDDFKGINNQYGHDGGDKALRRLVEIVNENIRGDDIICRLGGDEFVLLLRNTKLKQATLVVNRIQQQMKALAIENNNIEIALEASFAIQQVHTPCDDIFDKIKTADKGLFQAKNRGKNQIVLLQDGYSV